MVIAYVHQSTDDSFKPSNYHQSIHFKCRCISDELFLSDSQWISIDPYHRIFDEFSTHNLLWDQCPFDNKYKSIYVISIDQLARNRIHFESIESIQYQVNIYRWIWSKWRWIINEEICFRSISLRRWFSMNLRHFHRWTRVKAKWL